MPNDNNKRLLIFSLSRLRDMSAKGSVWYVRNYEVAFDSVHIAYLIGGGDRLEAGRTVLMPLGSGEGSIVDLLLAPFRLLQYARRVRPSVYLTGDQWYSWWTAILMRLVLRARVVLMPVSVPEQLYRDFGKTISGWPLIIDRLLRWLSFRSAAYVYTGEAFGSFVQWLRSDPLARDKLVVGKGLVEAMPTAEFLHGAEGIERKRGKQDGTFFAVYVGRLAAEKLVDHAIRAFALLPQEFRLLLVGDGSERDALRRLVTDLGVSSRVEFAGAASNSDLPAILAKCDAFVSTLTGTSLREAAILGMPIVAYDRDWLSGLLIHERDALLVRDGDIAGLAEGLIRLRNDPVLAEKISQGAKKLAQELWSMDAAQESLNLLQEVIRGDGLERRNLRR